ncbi:ATP-binding protein [Bacteroidota bacterium]
MFCCPITYPQIIHVPAQYTTIQAGINAANDFDTVLIDHGRYFENISFKGKPITVASRYIMDRDTMHIHETIIDGSKPVHSDTASTVLFISGEDSTSVLCGLTITGGTGTVSSFRSKNDRLGGGIIMYQSGGKIVRNLIVGNTLTHNRGIFVLGGGVFVGLINEVHRNIICEGNVIIWNTVSANRASQGGGIAATVFSGSLVIQNNIIRYNKVLCYSRNTVHGGGISIRTKVPETGIAIVKNNTISNNELLGNKDFHRDPGALGYRSMSGGGLMVVLFEEHDEIIDLSTYPLICNNTIENNHSDGRGGGIAVGGYFNKREGSLVLPKPIIIQNTISNNTAYDGAGIFNSYGNSLLVHNTIFNNICENEGMEILDYNNNVFMSKKESGKYDPDQIMFLRKNRLLLRSDGTWFSMKDLKDPSNLAVSVLPPLWRTWWAIVFYCILMLTAVLWYRNMLMKRVRLKHTLELERFEKERSQEMEQLKSRFFENISHEFRTPLTLISGPLNEFIRKEHDHSDDASSLLNLMKKNVGKLSDLISQLLELSRLETGNVRLMVTKGNLTEHVNWIVQSFLSLAESRCIIYEYYIPSCKEALFYDKDKLEKILNNLISNACKFTPPGGKVTVSLAYETNPSGRCVLLTVRDTGKGMSPEEKEKIFNRFFRTSEAEADQFEGTGIGLSMVKELVELYRGKIEVESEPGKGSSFRIRLPAGESQFSENEIVAPKVKAQDEVSSPDEYPGNAVHTKLTETLIQTDIENKTIILLVEDNRDLRKYIIRNLDPEYETVEAENGQIGIEKAMELLPDIVISDLMMPVLDGIELCTRLKQENRTSHIPFIMLTARADMESKLSGIEKGADAYMVKPFESTELNTRIKSLLEQRKKIREHYRREFMQHTELAPMEDTEEEFLSSVMRCVEKNLCDETFNVKKLSGEMMMSRTQLYRKLRAVTDFSPLELIRNMRLKQAARMFREGHKNITRVMYDVGFNTPSYFTECFRSFFGMNPSDYIKNINLQQSS